MSGGSYDYLYCKEPKEVFDNACSLADMAETLNKLGYTDVAQEMTEFSEYVTAAYHKIEMLSEQLKPVMKAVEYYESCDIGPDSLRETIEQYRNRYIDVAGGTDA